MTGHNLNAASSAVTIETRGLVLTTDVLCNLVALPMPELLPQRPNGTRGVWSPVWTYTGSASTAGQPDAECTTPVVDGSRVAWVSKQKHAVYAVDVTDAGAQPAPWSPLPLPTQFFAPGAWTSFLSLLMVNGSLWVPSHAADPPGALHVDLASGAMSWAPSNKTNTSTTGGAAGSCGAPHHVTKNPDAQSAIFVMDNVNTPLEYLRSDGFHQWTTTVKLSSGGRHEHPTQVDLGGARHCVLLIKPEGGSLHAMAATTISGIRCYNWPVGGQKDLANTFTVNASWASALAMLAGAWVGVVDGGRGGGWLGAAYVASTHGAQKWRACTLAYAPAFLVV